MAAENEGRMREGKRVLALNSGSSSLKYALFTGEKRELRGEVERIGAGGVPDHAAAVEQVFGELTKRRLSKPDAVGHRLVHGGPQHLEPTLVDDALLASLEKAVPFAPLHLPVELRSIAATTKHFGDVPQVVCFDTFFHRTMPEVAKRFALPGELFEAGVRRYGFHGISYEYVVESIGKELGARTVIAHLGSGASMVAVRDGKSIETTMGFTPTAGLVMSTRSGDLDPGLVVYLLEHRGYDAKKIDHLVNHEAGLLALSGQSGDMKALLEARAKDPRAALAVEAFCYQARKWVGALAAALGGLDMLVFTGGIGEHAVPVREEICAPLAYLGAELRVVETDEERMIARHTSRVVGG
jgi:acetate kinase